MTPTRNRAKETSTKKERGASSWRNEKTKNAARQIGFKDNGISQIERLVEHGQWSEARALIQEELVFQPADHWLWFMLGLTYYEQKEYEKALRCSEWAVHLKPACPLALWHYAGSLLMCGRGESALAIWISLINMDLNEVAYGDHGEGMDSALQLINDVQYRIGRYYQSIGRDNLARDSFRKYLHNCAHGVGSIYDTKQVNDYLTRIEAGSHG